MKEWIVDIFGTITVKADDRDSAMQEANVANHGEIKVLEYTDVEELD